MNGKEIISLLEKSKELPKINRNVLEIISLIDSTEKINMDVLAEKIERCGSLKYDYWQMLIPAISSSNELLIPYQRQLCT